MKRVFVSDHKKYPKKLVNITKPTFFFSSFVFFFLFFIVFKHYSCWHIHVHCNISSYNNISPPCVAFCCGKPCLIFFTSFLSSSSSIRSTSDPVPGWDFLSRLAKSFPCCTSLVASIASVYLFCLFVMGGGGGWVMPHSDYRREYYKWRLLWICIAPHHPPAHSRRPPPPIIHRLT